MYSQHDSTTTKGDHQNAKDQIFSGGRSLMRGHRHLKINVLPAISPVSVSDGTAQASAIIDRQGYDALEFIILAGSLADADATFFVTLMHGHAANLSDGDVVPADQLLGTLTAASFTFANDNAARKIGYVGARRYVQLTITPTGNTGAALMAVGAILGYPNQT